MNIAFAGVPKTMDNDISIIDKSFGFDTCCAEAANVVKGAYAEATGVINGIGLVRLFGRHSGYVA